LCLASFAGGFTSVAYAQAAKAAGAVEAKREPLPEGLEAVLATWQYDKNGKIIGVDFDNVMGAFDKRRRRAGDTEHLTKLPNLEKATIYADDITDDALKPLGKLTKLKELRLVLCNITSKGVAHLAPLKNLVVLDLSHTKVDDEGMKVVAKFEKLEELDLSETFVGDFGIACFFTHEKLRKLTIGSGSGEKNKLITDISIPTLSNLKTLRELDYLKTDIGDHRALERALAQAGLDSSKTNLEFSLRQNPFSHQEQQQRQDNGGEPWTPLGAGLDPDTPAVPSPHIIAYRGTASPGGINLFV
jgi:hypothetical protein